MSRKVLLMVLGACVLAVGPAAAQLRVTEWNITNYSGGRVSVFQTAIYDEFQGRSMTPDVIVAQELLSQGGVDAFVSLLNSAPGSPGDWAAAPFVNGPDTDNALFYRTNKIDLLGHTVVAVGGPSPNHPRNIDRYDLRLKGYTSAEATLACYSSHMKAGTGSTDKTRRLLEAQEIRADAEALPAGWSFLLAGDFNIQSSSQSAYVELVGSQTDNTGRLFDPIKTPGSWNNNSSYRFVHTQDPAGAGGMDDRHDQILLSASLVDADGFEYLGDPAIPYSTSTWNDTNHSYRSWGNDGTSYNTTLTITNNQMVGATIAQALVSSANGQGHLPVFLDLIVPAMVGSDTVVDFGQVAQGAVAEAVLAVENTGDTALWTEAGIAELVYTLSASGPFSVDPGPFADAAGGSGNAHVVAMDTSTPGVYGETLTIASNAPDEPSRLVTLIGEVVGCLADFNGDGVVNSLDFTAFLNAFVAGDASADFNGDGSIDSQDFVAFLNAFVVGC
jgi:endonuclease/exonuclease/phosphatase family metal-dependent hydrolase